MTHPGTLLSFPIGGRDFASRLVNPRCNYHERNILKCGRTRHATQGINTEEILTDLCYIFHFTMYDLILFVQMES